MADAVIWIDREGLDGPDTINPEEDDVFIVIIGRTLDNDTKWNHLKAKYGATEAARLIQTATVVPFAQFRRVPIPAGKRGAVRTDQD